MQDLIIHFWGYIKVASICPAWKGKNTPIPGRKRKEKAVGAAPWCEKQSQEKQHLRRY